MRFHTPVRHRQRPPNEAGFSMLELVVVLVVTGILAAVLTPILFNFVDEARQTRADLEVQNIARAIQNFNRNTGKWPIFKSGIAITTTSDYYEVLLTPGELPSVNDAAWLPGASERGDLEDVLNRNTPSYGTSGRFAWRGPYASELAADPWGNAYLVSAGNLFFGQDIAGMVLSAGPNGTVETTFAQDIGSGADDVVIGGDDVVARIR